MKHTLLRCVCWIKEVIWRTLNDEFDLDMELVLDSRSGSLRFEDPSMQFTPNCIVLRRQVLPFQISRTVFSFMPNETAICCA